MIYGSALGFATVGADNGHNGANGEPFLNNSEVLEDFVYRSYVHFVSSPTISGPLILLSDI